MAIMIGLSSITFLQWQDSGITSLWFVWTIIFDEENYGKGNG